MPIHDWTRVTAGTWHDFHLAWIAEIQQMAARTGASLPSSYYAQAEQIGGPLVPGRLALQTAEIATETRSRWLGGLAWPWPPVPPRARLVAEAEVNEYVLKRRTLVIRHSSGDRIVGMLRLVSPGSKSAQFRPPLVRREGRRGPSPGATISSSSTFSPPPHVIRREFTARSGPRSGPAAFTLPPGEPYDPGGLLGRPGQAGLYRADRRRTPHLLRCPSSWSPRSISTSRWKKPTWRLTAASPSAGSTCSRTRLEVQRHRGPPVRPFSYHARATDTGRGKVSGTEEPIMTVDCANRFLASSRRLTPYLHPAASD